MELYRKDLGDFRNAEVKMKAAVLGDRGKRIAYVGCLLVFEMDVGKGLPGCRSWSRDH